MPMYAYSKNAPKPVAAGQLVPRAPSRTARAYKKATALVLLRAAALSSLTIHSTRPQNNKANFVESRGTHR